MREDPEHESSGAQRLSGDRCLPDQVQPALTGGQGPVRATLEGVILCSCQA